MKINITPWIVVCAAALAPLAAQTHVDLRTQTKSADLSSVGATKPAQAGAALPSTCSPGEFFFLTSAPAGSNLTLCASANHWTAAASGDGSLALQANGTAAGTATTLNLVPGTYVTQTVACASGTCSYQPDVDTTKLPTNTAIQQGQLLAVISTSSSATAYMGVMGANDPLAAYTANQQLIWNVGSTACAGGPMTLNIDGLGAIPLKQGDGVTNLTPAQCGANAQVPITYDAVNHVFRGTSASAASGVSSITGDGNLISNTASTGSVSLTLANAGAHKWLGNNTGSAGAPAYSSLTAADIPTLNQSTTGNAATATALAATPALCSAGQAPTGVLANGNATGCAAIGGGGSLALQANGAGGGTATTLNLMPGTYVTQTIACAGGTCSYQPDVDTSKVATNTAIQLGQLVAVISTSSSSTAYTGVMAANDPLGAYAANQQLLWNVGSTACAGGAMTLNIDGLGTIPLKQGDGVTNLTQAQCSANAQLPIAYDGVNHVFRGPSASTASDVSSITGDGNLISNTSSTGSVSLTLANAGAHKWLGNNTGSAGAPAYSALTAADIPTLNQNTTGNAATATALAATPTLCSAGQAPTGVLANGNATGCAAMGGGGSLALQANGTSGGTATTLNLMPGTYVTQTVACAGGTCSYQPDVDTTKLPTNTAIQQGQLLAVISTSSSATAYTGVMGANDPLASYAANQQLIWNVGSTACAGGPMTLNIDGLGAVPLKQADGASNLTSLQCGANAQLPITYDAVNHVFRGTSASAVSGVSSITGDGNLISNTASTGSVSLTLANAGAHKWLGNNTGSAGAPAYSSLTAADIPTLNQSTTGNAATATALAATPALCSAGQAPTGVLANGNATGCAAIGGGGTHTVQNEQIFWTASNLSGSPSGGGNGTISSNTGATNQFFYNYPPAGWPGMVAISNSGASYLQVGMPVPANWTGAVTLKVWFTLINSSTGTGTGTNNYQVSCITPGTTSTATTQSLIGSPVAVNFNFTGTQYQIGQLDTITTLNTTGCVPGQIMYLRITRASTGTATDGTSVAYFDVSLPYTN